VLHFSPQECFIDAGFFLRKKGEPPGEARMARLFGQVFVKRSCHFFWITL
jgi:hypothetical protein